MNSTKNEFVISIRNPRNSEYLAKARCNKIMKTRTFGYGPLSLLQAIIVDLSLREQYVAFHCTNPC